MGDLLYHEWIALIWLLCFNKYILIFYCKLKPALSLPLKLQHNQAAYVLNENKLVQSKGIYLCSIK